MKYHFEAIRNNKLYAENKPIVMETNNASELRNFVFTYLSKDFKITVWRNDK